MQMRDNRRPSRQHRTRSLVAVVAMTLLCAALPLAGTALAFEGEIEVKQRDGRVPSVRFAGEDRFETAGLIATDDTDFAPRFGRMGEAETGTAGAESGTVLVARADIFPDALAGSVLGGLHRAPIILSPNNTDDDGGNLNADTEEALTELDPETITILGGTEAIDTDVEDALEDAFPSAQVDRIGGIDRFETAALIAGELPDGETSTAIVADGGDFPDALVAGAIAASAQIPILLTGDDGPLDPFTEERLEDGGFDDVLLAGGTDALSQDVEDQIEAIVGEGNTRRAAGETRIETAVEFAREGTQNYGFGEDHFNIATGFDFPDALALGPHAGLDFNGPAPILLTEVEQLPNATRSYLEEVSSCDAEAIHVAGGIAAVADDVEEEVREILTQSGEACTIELTPETATNLVGETHTVVAQVRDNTGNPATADGETLTVFFEVTPESSTASGSNETSTAQPTPESATVETNDNGFAQFSFTSETAGCVTITATAATEDNQVQAEASKCFVESGEGTDGGDGEDGEDGEEEPGGGTPPATSNGPFTFDEDAQGWVASRALIANPATNWSRGAGGTNDTDAFRLRLGVGATIAGYGDLSDARLTSPELTSPGGPQTLVFDINNDTEDGFDFVQVRFSTDGGTTFSDPVEEISGQTGDFETMEVPLGDIPAGPFLVRFQFVSDEILSTATEGFTGSTVDNVLVTSG